MILNNFKWSRMNWFVIGFIGMVAAGNLFANEPVNVNSVEKPDPFIVLTDSTDSSEEKVEQKPELTEKEEKRFQKIIDGDNPFSIADQNSRIYFTATNIINDNKYTYIKLYIINKSSSKYELEDFIIMQVEDVFGKRISSGMVSSKHIEPIKTHTPIDRSVNANASEAFGFVIPQYSGVDNGKLIIQIIEKNGSRNGKIEIKAKDITRAEIFKD